MQHVSKFQLIETTTYLFLLISLDKVTIIVLTKYATCILDKIVILVYRYIYIYIYITETFDFLLTSPELTTSLLLYF